MSDLKDFLSEVDKILGVPGTRNLICLYTNPVKKILNKLSKGVQKRLRPIDSPGKDGLSRGFVPPNEVLWLRHPGSQEPGINSRHSFSVIQGI